MEKVSPIRPSRRVNVGWLASPARFPHTRGLSPQSDPLPASFKDRPQGERDHVCRDLRGEIPPRMPYPGQKTPARILGDRQESEGEREAQRGGCHHPAALVLHRSSVPRSHSFQPRRFRLAAAFPHVPKPGALRKAGAAKNSTRTHREYIPARRCRPAVKRRQAAQVADHRRSAGPASDLKNALVRASPCDMLEQP